jgi:MFS family permease
VFLLSSLLLLASAIWAAKSGTSFESHLAARLVQGVAGGATESLLPLILTDISFVHERAYYFGAYWVVSLTVQPGNVALMPGSL